MQYRMALFEEIDLLVEQRLRFIEIDKSDKDYSEIKKTVMSILKKLLQKIFVMWFLQRTMVG